MTPTTPAIGEVRALLVRHLAELPLASTVCVQLPDGGALLLTTSRARASASLADGVICCTPLEYEALAIALEDGRCSREEALVELAKKREALGHTITLVGLVGAARGRDGRTLTCPKSGPMLAVPGIAQAAQEAGGPRWTVGELVDALGGELTNAVIEDGSAA